MLMRRLLFCLAIALPLCAEPKLEDLSWMTGHWAGSSDGWDMEEVWTAPAGGMMLGMHRDVKGSKASFEFIRIAATKDGVIYFAQPGGKPPTPFKLTEVTSSRAVFSNPEHDFPKRITYTLSDGRLCARVDGDGEKAEEWCWTKKP